MSEEIKTTRLNKVAKEFNVGVSTLVEHLAKKGHQVDSNPNTRITAEQYAILSQAFQGEREVKENADRIEIISGDTRSVNAAKTEEKEIKKEADEELVIKNYHPAKPADAETPSVSDTPAPKAEEEPVPEPEVPQAEEPQVEEPKAEEPKAEEPVEETPKFEPTVISATVAGAKEGKESFNAELRIVDKIDLSSLNEKTRPAKKSKSEKKAKKAETKPAAEEKPVEEKAPVVEETPAPVVEEAVVEETPVVETAPEPVAETPAPEPEKKVEFVPTQYTKLEGLKTVGKIDLSQFAREKVSPAEKRKRKRIKGEKVDQKAAAENVARGDKKENKPAKPNGGNGDAQKPNPNNDPNRNKDKAKEKKSKDKKAKGKEVKVEVDEAEIKKQIQDTLARLSPMGKSKTSKHNREKRQKVQQRFEEEMLHEMENQKTLQVTEFVTANELATMMNIPVTKIIATCMSVGIFVSINQRLDAEAIKLIADEFGFEINFVSTEVAEAINSIEEQDNPEDLVPRTPIITVMGHVDHGKTSLLDYIRNTNVIAGEAGGITQHIGAYEVTMPDGRKITFLDTPGHEAFTAMRARGAKVTDIAIIVIAADDKIMPQTIEAINHAQAAAVPMVFAINKIDKPGADPDRIKTELANMNLLVEEWGGKYQSQDISAKKGINVDQLLEKVLLEAEMLELKGNPKKRAKGTVLECSLDKGRGYVAKLLVEDGTISQGDPLVAGPISGRVKAMYNERNQLVKSAGPSQPVLLLGLTGACQAGDTFNVTENEKEAKDIAAKRQQLAREQSQRTTGRLTLDEIGRRRALGDFHEIKLIVKGDVDGSVEALSDSLIKLSTEEIQINVIHKAVGQITEGDVLLAEASDAIIIGFQVRPSVQARRNAEEKKIDIRLYSIIYDAINELHDAMEGMLAPETQEKIVANLEIRETFKISKVGTIAGCMCLDGKIQRSHNVRIIRDGIVVFTGKLASLKRFKDDVKEVVSGQDCGLNIENFNDIKVGDIVEAYEIIEIKRTLK